MSTYSQRTRTFRARWWAALLVVVAAGLLVGAAPAAAAPPATLDLAGLRAELDAHGTVDGVMRTSMSGTSVTTIPVKVLAIVDGFYWGKLIMFECTDPAVTDIGGIAAGMSGSPIYVTVGGVDYMIGAVSYGDWFTLRGTGLATPIEYMTAIQQQYGSAARASDSSATVKLDRPVATSTGVVRKLVLGTKAQSSDATSDTSVMHPLAEAMITGLSKGTTAYQKLAAKLEASGLTVLSGNGAGAPSATPALEAGSPAGVSYSNGLYALYVLGTVTYVDGSDVLLFGHPTLGGYSGMDLGLGPIEGTLIGATVDALWPSTYTPYKMMTPADAKGVATQDRSAGELATLGGSAPTFPVTTHATVNGGAPVTDVTNLGSWFATSYWPELADSWGESSGITTSVASAGLYHALDSDPLLGSATTTTTVVVSDGTQDYTFTRDNIWDNSADESWWGLADAAASDVTTIMGNVLSDPYNVRDVEVKSVDVSAAFSDVRRRGGITDANVARAIRWGSSTVDVTYYHTGSTTPQTLHATLDIPEGTELSGTLMVMPTAEWDEYYSDYYYDDYYGSASGPLTLAETKEIVDALPVNSDVIVAYVPDSSDYEDEEYWDYGPKPAAEQVIHGDWVFQGSVEKETADVTLRSRGTVAMGQPLPAYGYIRGASDDVTVAIYAQEAGKPEPTKPVAKVLAEKSGSRAQFTTTLRGARHNVLLTAEVGALSDDSLPGASQMVVKVRARTRLSAAHAGGGLRLTARVAPADTDGKVVFQRQVHGRWVAAGSAKLQHGTATVRTNGAAKVRARFTGGSMNAASGWTTIAVK
jgi:hypothetical protein